MRRISLFIALRGVTLLSLGGLIAFIDFVRLRKPLVMLTHLLDVFSRVLETPVIFESG